MKNKTSFKKGQMAGSKHPGWKGGVSTDKDYRRNYQRTYLQKMRRAVLEAFGGACASCGFNDERALQIDHIDGGGSEERKTKNFKGTFHKHVLTSFLNKEKKYQLLCANCNWIKRVENKEMKRNYK